MFVLTFLEFKQVLVGASFSFWDFASGLEL
jgi:hypothetical protein